MPPALLVGLAGLVLLVEGERNWRGAFATGMAFGLAHFVAGLYWVGNAFSVAGIVPWAAPFAVAALASSCALFVAAACAAHRALAPHGAWRPVVFASLWTLGEWLRGTLIFGGFPWNLTGYLWTPWPAMAQLAAVVGVYGLGWLTVFAASSPAAFAGSARSWRTPVAALALLVVNGAFGFTVLARADGAMQPDVRLRLVQANVAQHHKWREDLIADRFRRHADLSTAPASLPPTVVIWPETASPYDLSAAFEERTQAVRSVPPNGALLAGAVRTGFGSDQPPRIWNSLQALDDAGRVVGAYDKFHLVPFGEYSPFRGVFLTAGLGEWASGFSRGPGPQTLEAPGAPPFGPLICYEAIFPGDVVGPAVRPEWLLNVTNDAWYGISSGPYQHFEQTRLRAVEEGLPLVRVANTGISGVIDSYGRVVAKSALGETAVIDSGLPAPRSRPTAFSYFGNAPAVTFSLGVLVLFAARYRGMAFPPPGSSGTAARRADLPAPPFSSQSARSGGSRSRRAAR